MLLVAFVVRELTADEPILDLTVYSDRNFAAGSVIMLVVMIGFFSSMVLIALFTQKVLGYDAWTSGLVLAPGGVGNLLSLLIAGRLITRMDQRWLLALGCLFNAYATYEMSTITLNADYWALAWPRLHPGRRHRLHLRAPQHGGPGHHLTGADGQRHRPAERGPEPGRRHRRRAAHDDAGPAQPGASDHAGRAHQRVGSGDGGTAAAVGARISSPRAPTASRRSGAPSARSTRR